MNEYVDAARNLELMERPVLFPGRSLLPLVALIEDDFGTRLIAPDERKRIRYRLVEGTLHEASLSS